MTKLLNGFAFERLQREHLTERCQMSVYTLSFEDFETLFPNVSQPNFAKQPQRQRLA